jgi:hypothetical protein
MKGGNGDKLKRVISTDLAHEDGPSLQLGVVQLQDGSLRALHGGKLNQPAALRAPRRVGHDVCAHHGAHAEG